MKPEIVSFVENCLICQQAKISQLQPASLLSPLPILRQIWNDVAMDFITGLSPSHGFLVIMAVIDRLSKYAHFAALKSTYKCSSSRKILSYRCQVARVTILHCLRQR